MGSWFSIKYRKKLAADVSMEIMFEPPDPRVQLEKHVSVF